jgi:hypothetical protein
VGGLNVPRSAHSNASQESAGLCDKLFEELANIIPNLQRNPTKGSCGIWQSGKTRFAYVYHSKCMSQIEIWCRGDIAELLKNDSGLGVQGRKNPRQGWEVSYPVRFRVYRQEQIPVAARYLKDNSYRATSFK